MAYGKYRNGITSLGRQAANWMQDDKLSFTTRRRGNVVVRKSGEFTNIFQQEVKDPYLWGFAYRSNNSIVGARAAPEQAFSSLETFAHSAVYGTQNFVPSASSKYVGDNYVLYMLCNALDASTNLTAYFWPALTRADGQGTEYPAETLPDPHGRVSVSFFQVAGMNGLGALDVLNVGGGPGLGGGHSYALFACGWSDETLRYRFGLTALYYADPANKTTTRVPVAFTGSTGLLSMSQVSYPFYPGRDHMEYTSFTAGPGVVQALNTVTEDPTGVKPQLPPYLAQSTDHGSSWTSLPTTFLAGLLYEHPVGPGHARPYYDNTQLNFMGRYTTIIYMGGGVSLLIVPNAYVDGSIAAGDARFCAALFVSTGGGAYTRQAWPADTWYVNVLGRIDTGPGLGTSNVMFSGVTLMRTGHFATGPGRAYLPVYQDGVVRAMVTTDYGATWSLTPPVPPEIISTYIGIFNGVVTRASSDPAQPETIVFPAPDYAAGRLRFLKSKDLLQTFTPHGSADVGGLTTPLGNAQTDLNYCFVNYGGKRRKPAVFPAFPLEFNKP